MMFVLPFTKTVRIALSGAIVTLGNLSLISKLASLYLDG